MEKLSKRQLGFLLAGALLLVSVIQPFTNRAFNDVFVLSEGYSAWWLIILYLVGGYIRKYGLFRNIKAHRTGIFLSLYLIITLLTCFLTLMLKRFADRFCIDSNVFVKYQSITMVAAAVFLFLAFENVKFNRFFARIVGFLSPLAFSVYLIHVQPFVYDITITGHFIKIGHLPLPLMVLSIVGIAIAIYLVCSAIDLIRHCLFKAVKLKEGLLNLEDRIKLKLNRRKSN